MLKKLLCAVLAMLMCLTTVMLAVSCADKDTGDTSPDTTLDTPSDTTPDTELPSVETLDKLTPSNGKRLKVAIIGDSITQGTGTSNQPADSYPGQLQSLLGYSDFTIGNFGRASAYTLPASSPYNVWASSKPDLSYKDTQQFKDSIAFKPDVVIIMMGINDMRSMTSDAAKTAFKSALKNLCETYGAEETVQKVIIATSIHVVSNYGAKQMSDGELQGLQRKVAEELGLDVYDIYTMTRDYMDEMFHYTGDRLHPNKEMYGVMAKAYKACMLGEEFTAPAAPKTDTGVVYLKSSGSATADGKTPATAVNKLGIAVSRVRDGGTVVVCGPYTLDYEAHLPANSAPITVTSKYNGTDYASQGAKLTLSKHLGLFGDFKFENISIHSSTSTYISCNYNNVTFGDGIVSTASGLYPSLMCGYVVDSTVSCEQVSLKGECNIVVNSGKFAYINAGNRRSKGNLTVGSSDKDAVINITVNGGEFTHASGVNLNGAVGMNSFAGTCNFTVNGGSFAGKFYAVHRIGDNTTKDPSEMSGTVNLVINGGSFASSIAATQDATSRVTGKINITIPASLESKLVGFTNVTKK